MYLSRVFVNWPRSKNAYTIHQALWVLFPGQTDEQRNFLFRVEKEKTGLGASILLQSDIQPKSNSESVMVNASKNIELNFGKGQKVRFLLKANPIKTIKDEKGRKNSKGDIKNCRVPLIKEDEQLAWLSRKLQGFAQLDEIRIIPMQPFYFKKKAHAGKIKAVQYEGILNIVDEEGFLSALENGIGPAKALGCGMISVAPA